MAKIEKKEILQAVVIADNFNDHFKPFTFFNSPVRIIFSIEISVLKFNHFQALLPLLNVPLITYALESLNQNGVEEVWIFCSSFVDKVREFIR